MSKNNGKKAQAKEIHFKYGVVDSHCDTVHYFTGEKGDYDFVQRNSIAHLDLPRMEEGGIKIQFFALFIEPEYKPFGSLKRCLHLLNFYYKTVEPCHDRLETIYNIDDLERINNQDKMAALITIEGGEALEGDIGVLRMLFRLGIRGVGLTWNQRNNIADGIGEREANGGLTLFGKKVIREMNELGMIVDLAHISEKGFHDVLALTDSPVIVSHANSRALCGHPRNLTDQQLKLLKQNGGIIGLSFYPTFIDEKAPSFEKLLDHFEHVAHVIGVEHLGIGSDYDGIKSAVEGLNDVSFLPALTEGLLSRGFKEKEIGKILYGNYYRLIKEVFSKNNTGV
ncbi:MAG: dipeptidase [Dethiobacteria bacterium]